MSMPNKKVLITNSIIMGILFALGFLVNIVNVSHTYVAVNAPLQNGDRDTPAVGLMFVVDDNSQTANLAPIMETLTTAGAGATFFITGATAMNNLDVVQSAAKFGLGNYGFDQTPLNIADKNQITESIALGDSLLTAIGQTTLRWFTPPGGLYNKNTMAMAQSQGYTMVLPTDRGAVIDWDTTDSNLVLSYATYQVNPGDIILLKPTTATGQCFSQLLATLVMRGLQVTSLDDLLTPRA